MNYIKKIIDVIYDNGAEADMVTKLSDIKEFPDRSYTVARVMNEKHCVELHYCDGEVWLEIDQRESEDSWCGNIEDVDWFNFDLTEDEIFDKLEVEFAESFGYQYRHLLPRNDLER